MQVLKSAVQKRTLDPVFDETFVVDIWSVMDRISFTLYDWDAVGSNDFLGVIASPSNLQTYLSLKPQP